LRLRPLERHPALELLEQAGDGVHVHHEGVHAGQRLGRGLDDDVDAVPRMFRSASVTSTAISTRASRCLSSPVISQSTQMMRSLMARVELEVTGPQYRGRARRADGERRERLLFGHLVSTTSRREPREGPAMNMYLRLLLFLLRVRGKSPLSIWDTSHTSFRVNP